jgi:hypothetical protein
MPDDLVEITFATFTKKAGESYSKSVPLSNKRRMELLCREAEQK